VTVKDAASDGVAGMNSLSPRHPTVLAEAAPMPDLDHR